MQRDNPQTIYGMRIFITADHPKMQLSEDCPVTPAFREEMNKWMLEFFGVKNLVPDGRVVYAPSPVWGETNQVAYMNQRTYNRLLKENLQNNIGAM